MTNNEVIQYLAQHNILMDIIKNIGYLEDEDNLKDLHQDLMLELLERNDDLLVKLYNANQLKYYLTRIVINNIRSKNSRYYYKYKKDDYLKESLTNDRGEELFD